MATPITTIRNVGPAVAAACKRAGLTTAEEVRALGADETYARMIEAGTRPHFIGYYALVMGLQGRPLERLQGQRESRTAQTLRRAGGRPA